MLSPKVGTIVFGRYSLRREIARGGMGSVWEALDKRLRRRVAMKLMQPMWANSPEARRRFEREAMAVAQLRSPHIVQIFDYGIDHEIPFIVMEMLEGEDLKARLARDKHLSLSDTCALLAQAAKGLSVAHAASIIHRDLKPANLFLVRSGDDELLKLLDFGVAKADAVRGDDEEATRAGMVLGTPQYMSPEQARGLAEVDHRADLWSLAVIAYRALTGKVPFSGKTATDIIVKMCTRLAPPPTSRAPHLPPAVDGFFAKALALRPEDRFASARELALAFAAMAPVSFPSLSMPEPPPELFARRRRPPSPPASRRGPPAPRPPGVPPLLEMSDDDDMPTPPSAPASVELRRFSAGALPPPALPPAVPPPAAPPPAVLPPAISAARPPVAVSRPAAAAMVDARPSPRRRRRRLALLVALFAAFVIGAAVTMLGGGEGGSAAADRAITGGASAARSTAGALGAGSPSAASSSAATVEPVPGTASVPTPATAVPSATARAAAPGAHPGSPHPRPHWPSQPTPHPPATPSVASPPTPPSARPVAEPDPFSERL